MLLDVLLERRGVVLEEGHGHVAGQYVVQRGNIGGALDGGVAAQGENAATRPADVAEKELENGGCTNDLHAGGMLSPADGVADAGGLVRPRCVYQGFGDL